MKHKIYSYSENPFRWQVHQRFKKLREKLSHISPERVKEIAKFIVSESHRLNSAGEFVSNIHDSLLDLIVERMHNHIREEALTLENYRNWVSLQEEHDAREREAREESFERDCSGMNGRDRAIMRAMGYDPESDDEENSEEDNDTASGEHTSDDENLTILGSGRQATYAEDLYGDFEKWIDDEADGHRPDEWDGKEDFRDWHESAVTMSRDAEGYRVWAKGELERFADLEDPENLLEIFFGNEEGHSWFIHDLMMDELEFEERLLEEMNFTEGGIQREEVEIVLAAIDMFIDWESAEVCDADFIPSALAATLESFAQGRKSFEALQDAAEKLEDRLLYYGDDEVGEEYRDIEARYNTAIRNNDFILAQKLWSIYTSYRKYLHDKELIGHDGESVTSYAESLNSLSNVKIGKQLKAALAQAEKYYPMRFYPHPDTKRLIYVEGEHVTEFDLAGLMGELESIGKSLEPYRDTDSRNVFVPAFVFVVSTEPDASGKVTRKFLTVKLDLHSALRVLSRNPVDGVMDESFNLVDTAKQDIVNGYKVFATEDVGIEALRSIGIPSNSLYHSERVLVQVMRHSDNVMRIVELLRIAVMTEFEEGYRGKYIVDAVALVGYSTNTVCRFCSPTLIYLQNSREDGGPLNLLVKGLNMVIEGRINFVTKGYDHDSGEQDYSQFRLHTIITATVNFDVQANDMTDHHSGRISKPTAKHNPKAKLVLPSDAVDLSLSVKLGDGSYSLGQPYIIEFCGVNHTPSASLELGCFSGVCFTSGDGQWGASVPKEKLIGNQWYTEDQIQTLLHHYLPDVAGYYVVPQTQFEHRDVLRNNLGAAIAEVMEGRQALMPIHLHGNHWAGAIIRRQLDGNIQVIYNDPMGNSLEAEENALLFVEVLQELAPEINIVDLRIRQQKNGYDCGPFTVDNLRRLATTDINLDNLTAEQIRDAAVLYTPDDGQATALRVEYAPILHAAQYLPAILEEDSQCC